MLAPDDVVAVALAACHETTLDLTRLAAQRLATQVVNVEFVHETAHGALHLTAARSRVVAVRRADDADASEFEPAENRFLLDLVARKAVERFDNEHVEAGRHRVGHKPLASRA
ncbi:hypothetical protein PQR54_17990 [Paraburkholderia phytofirmans]